MHGYEKAVKVVFAIIANSTLKLVLLEAGILVLREMRGQARSYVLLAG